MGSASAVLRWLASRLSVYLKLNGKFREGKKARHIVSGIGRVTRYGVRRLIVGQPENHVFSQPPGAYSRMSTAPPAPSWGHTRIKDRRLIEPLIDPDRRAIRALNIYKKALSI